MAAGFSFTSLGVMRFRELTRFKIMFEEYQDLSSLVARDTSLNMLLSSCFT